MRRVCWKIAGWLLAGVAAGWGLGSAALRGDERTREAGRTLQVTSGRQVGLERTALSHEAEQKAQEQLAEQLILLAEQLTGRRLSRRQLAQEQAWLLQHPGVDYRATDVVEEKSYGLVAERKMVLHIPQTVLASWSERLVRQHQRRHQMLITAGAATVMGWLIGWAVLVVLDRLSGGYHRRMLGLGALVLLTASTAVGWAWVYGSL